MRYTIRNLQSPISNFLWVICIVIPVALFWRIVFDGQVLFWGAPLLQFFPWQQLAVEMWSSGNVPLWNPFVGNGAPLAANLQSAVFYPLNVFYLVWPVEQAMGYTAVLHVMLAGLAMYAWGRTFGLRPLAALVSAMAFQLSQFFIARLGFLSITATFPWMAVWLWRAEVLLRRRRLSDALWLALAIGLGLLAGHAQTAGLGLIVMALYAALRIVQDAKSTRSDQETMRRLLAAFGGLSSAIILGFALAAVQLLPTMELTAQSQRAGGLDYEFAVTHSLYPLRLLTFIAPDLMGHPTDGNFWGYDNYWENAGYVGVWALLMVAFALTNLRFRGRRSEAASQNPASSAWFFGIAAIVSLLIALGRFLPVYGLLYHMLPGAALFQGPARLLSVYTLAVCALAGIGTEQLLQSERWYTIGRILLVAGMGVLLAAIAGAILIHLPKVLIRPMLQLGVTLCACGACLALRPPSESPRFTWWAAALIGVIAVDLLVSDGRLNPVTDAALYRSPTASAQAIRASDDGRTIWFAKDEETIKFERYLSFKSFGPEDVKYWVGLRETLLPNTAMIERVSSASNFDSLLPRRYNDLLSLINKLPQADALRLAGMMDARYIVSPFALPMPVEHRGSDVIIYRNDAALGRAWIVPQARIASNSLIELADPAFDPRRQVIFESADVSAVPPAQFPSGRSSVTLRDSPNTVTILAASDSGGFLVLADTSYPGWQATLDGVPAKILRANYAFRAVVLPPGEHTVVFRYAPLTFRVGVAISLAALVVVIGMLVRLSWRYRRGDH